MCRFQRNKISLILIFYVTILASGAVLAISKILAKYSLSKILKIYGSSSYFNYTTYLAENLLGCCFIFLGIISAAVTFILRRKFLAVLFLLCELGAIFLYGLVLNQSIKLGYLARDTRDTLCSTRTEPSEIAQIFMHVYTPYLSNYCSPSGCLCEYTRNSEGNWDYLEGEARYLTHCENWESVFYNNIHVPGPDLQEFMGELEETDNCSGICTKEPYYCWANLNTTSIMLMLLIFADIRGKYS